MLVMASVARIQQQIYIFSLEFGHRSQVESIGLRSGLV